MVAGRDMPTAKLPAALRDRAGKIATTDANSGEYLLQAARRIDDLFKQILDLQRYNRELNQLVDTYAPDDDADNDVPPASSPGKRAAHTYYTDAGLEESPTLWEMDGPSADDLYESEY